MLAAIINKKTTPKPWGFVMNQKARSFKRSSFVAATLFLETKRISVNALRAGKI